MRWDVSKKKDKSPKIGDTKRKRKFAFFPTRVGSYMVLFDFYWIEYKYQKYEKHYAGSSMAGFLYERTSTKTGWKSHKIGF